MTPLFSSKTMFHLGTTTSAPTRSKGALAVIWACAVAVFLKVSGSRALIYLKVRDRALGVARGDEFGAPLDDKPRTSHLRKIGRAHV